jgi:hypothetical protein
VLLSQPLQTTLLPTPTFTTEELRSQILCDSSLTYSQDLPHGGSFFI